MTALRDPVQSVAAQRDGSDSGAGVARDVGSRIRWNRGFLRVGEG